MAATAPPPPANATSAELIRWVFALLNAHDIEPLRAYWTPETFERFPDRTCTGPEEIAAYFNGLFAALPDLHMELLHLVADGEDVFARWHLTGTHSGTAWVGIEPTGARIELDGIDHFTVRDGKIASEFVVFDQMEVGRQMGLLPGDGSPADKALKTAFNAKTKIADAIRERRGG